MKKSRFEQNFLILMVDLARFELATSCVPRKHSNQLSYRPLLITSIT